MIAMGIRCMTIGGANHPDRTMRPLLVLICLSVNSVTE